MNKSDLTRNEFMLKGPLSKKGYDWWWHSFTARHKETGEEKAFYIEYFVCNPALGGDEVILGQDPANKKAGKRPSYVMVNVGTWGKTKKQLHGFYPISAMQVANDKLELKVGDCFLSETEMYGAVEISESEAANPGLMCDAGQMSWKLTINKKIAFHVGYGASKFFRSLNAFEMFWHAEGMKTEYAGTVVLDGVEYEVTPETCFGYADKNWGSNFTSPWVWLSSCNMTSKQTGKRLKNSVVNIGGGRPVVFGVALDRKLLSNLYYEGADYEFNFSKFWTLPKTAFKGYETETEIVWEVLQENAHAVMEVEIHCRKDEMLLINYEAPDGLKRHNRLWNGGTGTGTLKLFHKKAGKKEFIDEIEMRNIGCEYGEYSD